MDDRVRSLSDAPANPRGRYLLYHCRHHRRTQSNHALHFAASQANRLRLPLLVFESLSCDYPYASDRLHTFVLEGVPERAAELRQWGAGHIFELLRRKGQQSRLAELTAQAAAVVADDYPGEVPTATWAVDSNCIVPSHAIEKRMYAAYALRPRIRRQLPQFLRPVPAVQLEKRYRGAPEVPKGAVAELVASCQIDHAVPPSTRFRGGRARAQAHLDRFLHHRLSRYARDKNEPGAHATSDLSPYLHAGYLSSLEVALAVQEYARRHKLIADEFLEELIVRRELAFNFAWHAAQPDTLAELPEWARQTLHKHRRDPRPKIYTREQFERADTYDNLWNAAQTELLLRGKIHGYYRMYWGKKILEWSETPARALATMVYLNDRYALDGQDPNGYANILWCLGLHDRPWPERPVFGTVRSMVRAGMERKTDVGAYIQEIRQLQHTGEETIE